MRREDWLTMAVVALCGLALLLAITLTWPPTVVTIREEPTPRTVYLVVTATAPAVTAGPAATRAATPTLTPVSTGDRLPMTPVSTATATATAVPTAAPRPSRPAVQRG